MYIVGDLKNLLISCIDPGSGDDDKDVVLGDGKYSKKLIYFFYVC